MSPQRQRLSVTQIYNGIASDLGHGVLNRRKADERHEPVEAESCQADLEIAHHDVAVIGSARHEDITVGVAAEKCLSAGSARDQIVEVVTARYCPVAGNH